MKARVHDKVILTEPVRSDFRDEIMPVGTEGVIVEAYEDPEGYAVDLAIRDESLVGDHRYENVILKPHQFRVAKRNNH